MGLEGRRIGGDDGPYRTSVATSQTKHAPFQPTDSHLCTLALFLRERLPLDRASRACFREYTNTLMVEPPVFPWFKTHVKEPSYMCNVFPCPVNEPSDVNSFIVVPGVLNLDPQNTAALAPVHR